MQIDNVGDIQMKGGKWVIITQWKGFRKRKEQLVTIPFIISNIWKNMIGVNDKELQVRMQNWIDNLKKSDLDEDKKTVIKDMRDFHGDKPENQLKKRINQIRDWLEKITMIKFKKPED
jgi:hypothetical protein